MQLAVGGSIRYEAADAPSANSDINGPTQRYFTLNAFGTSGSRWIRSGFFELGAPIIDQIEVNLSGRYDDYSSGQNAFSPKAGVKSKPIKSLLLRATWSKGFRIPLVWGSECPSDHHRVRVEQRIAVQQRLPRPIHRTG